MSQAQERRAEERVDQLKQELFTLRTEIAGQENPSENLKTKEKDLQDQLSIAQQMNSY
jgi:ribosomal protein L29